MAKPRATGLAVGVAVGLFGVVLEEVGILTLWQIIAVVLGGFIGHVVLSGHPPPHWDKW